MLNLYHLRYFADAVELGSLSAASGKNHVGRSAISQAIRALEQSLGVELLAHGKNSFELTAEGKALHRHCDGLFSTLKRLQDEVRETSAGTRGLLNLAISHSVAVWLLPEVLERFTKKHPHIEVAVHLGNTTRIRELLDQQAVDIGIAVREPNESFGEYDCAVLRKGKFVLVQGDRKPAQARFLIGDKGAEVVALKKALRKRSSKETPQFMEVQSWEVIASLARQGVGYGFIPDFMLQRSGTKPLKLMPGSEPIHSYELLAISRTDSYRLKTVEFLLSEFKA